MIAEMARNRIKEIMDAKDITPYRLAKDTGLSPQTVYPLYNAEEIPPNTFYRTLKAIADYLGVGVDDLEEDNGS